MFCSSRSRMRNNPNTLFIIQKLADILSVWLYQISNFMNSVMIMVMTKIQFLIANSSAVVHEPNHQSPMTFSTVSSIQPPMLRPSGNLLYNHSYPQLHSHSQHGSTSSASKCPKAMNGLMFPFLMIKTALMPRVINLLFILHQNHIWC